MTRKLGLFVLVALVLFSILLSCGFTHSAIQQMQQESDSINSTRSSARQTDQADQNALNYSLRQSEQDACKGAGCK